MNGDPVARESLKSFYGYKETFSEQTVWVDIPRELTFVHTTNPYEDEEGLAHDTLQDSALEGEVKTQAELSLSQALYPTYATHGLEALSAVASDQYNYAPAPTTMSQQELADHAAAAVNQNLDFLLNPSGALASPTNLDPQLHTPTSQQADSGQAQSPHHVRTLSYTSARPMNLHPKAKRSHAIQDRELAFFLRDFSERAGHWMDIFDLDCFFGAQVPVLATKCPLLLYACAALSAKSLARVNGRKPIMNGQTSKSGRSKLEHWPGLAMNTESWVRKGRENYDVAVSLLRQSLTGVTASQMPTAAQGPLPSTDSDELVAATAILCVYEFLDASGIEWSRHLDGAKSLFDVTKEGMSGMPSPAAITNQVSQHLADGINSEMMVKMPTQGRIAVFWNFARQDMLSAFINSTRTRLNTNDTATWQSAGLKLTFNGRVCTSNTSHADFDRDNCMQDDMICNALVWLMAKLANFIAASEGLYDAISPLGLDARHQALIDEWNDLDDQLRVWYDGLPSSFDASVVYAIEGEHGMEEKWFPRSMCGSTMQSYHFSRIQLLHHKPASIKAAHRRLSGSAGSSLAARHAEYTSILKQTRQHAKEIVSIALGRADEGARVHAVQPLWTAGLVLGGSLGEDAQISIEAEMWRCTIVTLLRAIERDMGWAAEYRVQSLLELWNLPHDWDPEDFTLM